MDANPGADRRDEAPPGGGMDGTPAFTVFTPTYNRARLLPRVHDCLKAQTFRSFEWVIVDDGSSDGTESLVREWQAEGALEIRYLYQPNGGKHVATNRGVEMARGRYFAILDSDDWYTPTALERMLAHWETIPAAERHRYTGVVGLFEYSDGRLVGTRFPCDPLDSDAVDLRMRHHVAGDKIGMIRIEVMREFPFPFEGTRGLVTEAIVWLRMAEAYRTRFVNEVFARKEYQAAGLSDRALLLQIQAADATRTYHAEFLGMRRPKPIRELVRSAANFTRFSLHARVGLLRQGREVRWAPAWCACVLLGWALYRLDHWRARPAQKPR